MAVRPHHPGLQLQATLARWRLELTQPGTSHERVHASRVALKEARAILRLFRSVPSEFDAEAWNGRLREAMKRLAPARDQQIIRAVLREQAKNLPHPDSRSTLPQTLPQTLPRPPRPSAAALQAVLPLLESLVAEAAPAAQHAGWEPIDSALTRSWRQVRQWQSRAGATHNPEPWHVWRRRAKALAYQLDFVQPPDMPSRDHLRQAAWELQSRLGALQDLNITLHHLNECPLPPALQKLLRSRLRQAARAARKHAWKARLQKSLGRP
jgi:CHAD domain-containing protein